jgi:uncharacterized delta-60 repeat protein
MSIRRGLTPLFTLVATLAVPVALAGAAAGDPDPTFDGDGRRYLSLGGADSARALFEQPGGRLLVVGFGGEKQDFKMARLNADGSGDPLFRDSTADFGGDDKAYAATLAPNQKVLVAGSGGAGGVAAVARFDRNGGLDESFDPDGKEGDGKKLIDDLSAVRGVFVQPEDGYIVLVGSSFDVRRLSGTGAADGTTFEAPDLGMSYWSNGAALQRDGKIVAVGGVQAGGKQLMAVVRWTPDGKLDDSFGGDGTVTFGVSDTAIAYAALVQPDGKLLVAGMDGDGSDAAVVRLRADGNPDPTFGRGGTALVDFGGAEQATTVALQRDGKVVVSGVTSVGFFQFATARLGTTGALDRTFSGDGKAVVQFGAGDIAWASTLLGDGRLMLAGETLVNANAAIARLQADAPRTTPGPGATRAPRCGGRRATIVGTGKRNVLRGTRKRDVIAGRGGNDVIRGLRGNDVICGGPGRDRLIGGGGRDRCLGGPGRDRARCEIERSA